MALKRSDLWQEIAAHGDFEMETVVEINGKTYASISAPVIDRALFSDKLSVGNCISSSLQFDIMTEDTIQRSAAVVVKSRISENGKTSEWLKFGKFWISERHKSESLMSLVCYDAMLKANQQYADPSNPDDRIGWPKRMSVCVTEIAQRIGVQLDSRTVIKTADQYQVSYPDKLTMLQVLGYIGACHGGNWIITPENKLRLVPLVSIPPETFDIIDERYNRIYTNDNYGLVWKQYNATEINEAGGELINVPVVIGGIETGRMIAIKRVTIARDSEMGYTAGDDTGEELRIMDNPYASQAICNDLYSVLRNVEYAPFSITDSCYDPCAELGDWIIVGDKVASAIYKQTLTFGNSFRANVSAPGSDEQESEYPFLTEYEKLKQADDQLKVFLDKSMLEVDSAILQTRKEIDLEVQARQRFENETHEWKTSIQLDMNGIHEEVSKVETNVDKTITEYKATVDKTIEGISSTVSKKVGKDEIISQINQSAEQIGIKAEKIRLEGIVTVDGNVKITEDGRIIAKNGEFSGTVKTNGADNSGNSLVTAVMHGSDYASTDQFTAGITFYNVYGNRIGFYRGQADADDDQMRSLNAYLFKPDGTLISSGISLQGGGLAYLIDAHGIGNIYSASNFLVDYGTAYIEDKLMEVDTVAIGKVTINNTTTNVTATYYKASVTIITNRAFSKNAVAVVTANTGGPHRVWATCSKVDTDGSFTITLARADGKVSTSISWIIIEPKV